jgi:predicted nuclease with TOPRIM domain
MRALQLARVEQGMDSAGGRTMKGLEKETPALEEVDQRFEQIEKRFEQVDKSLHALNGGIARLERKLDRILALSVESRGRNHH